MNAPHINRYRLNDGLQTWTDHWALLNGVLMCIQCGAWQNPSKADLPFSHAEDCALRHDDRQRPWQALTELLGELPAVPGRFGGAERLEANALLAPLNLPVDLHAQACKLLHAIGVARGLDDLRRAADRAEGFALGVEILRALTPGNVECLYLAFDYAEQVRQTELGVIGEGICAEAVQALDATEHCARIHLTERKGFLPVGCHRR